jgi:hypothetical protein
MPRWCPRTQTRNWPSPNFKGFGHRPLLAHCDNTAEPLAGKLRKGSAGSNTVADHLESWTRRSPRCRRHTGGS